MAIKAIVPDRMRQRLQEDKFSFTPPPKVSTHTNLIEALMAAKRKAKLAGSTLSGPERTGITGGYFGGAADRLAAYKQHIMGLRGQKYQEWYGERMLELERERLEAEKKAARRAGKRSFLGL